jgi:hypothetical protein
LRESSAGSDCALGALAAELGREAAAALGRGASCGEIAERRGRSATSGRIAGI